MILAVGRERRKLGLPREDEWTGRGVSFCAVCDAPLYRTKVAAVVGGGDAAVKGAVLLSKYADKVYIIYRRPEFVRPESVNLQQLMDSPNIEPIFSANVIELKGVDGLSSVVLDRQHDGSNEITLDGLFIEIGADPRVELAQSLGAELNEKNEVHVDKEMRTNVHGVLRRRRRHRRLGRPETDDNGRRPGGHSGHLRLLPRGPPIPTPVSATPWDTAWSRRKT